MEWLVFSPSTNMAHMVWLGDKVETKIPQPAAPFISLDSSTTTTLWEDCNITGMCMNKLNFSFWFLTPSQFFKLSSVVTFHTKTTQLKSVKLELAHGKSGSKSSIHFTVDIGMKAAPILMCQNKQFSIYFFSWWSESKRTFDPLSLQMQKINES